MEAQVSTSAANSGTLNLDVWYNFFLTAGFGETASRQHAATFKAHEMELDMVPDLTHEVLLQMGFTKAGPRIRIMRLREVIINPKNGEIVPDAADSHVHVPSFTYGGQTYSTNSAAAPSQEHIPVVTKPILIPLTLEKKKAGHSSATGESPTKSLEAGMARPASTSILAHPVSSKADFNSSTPLQSPHTPLDTFNVAAYTVQHASAPSSPDHLRKAHGGLSSSSSALHSSLLDLQSYQHDSESGPVEGTFTMNPETGELVPSPSLAPAITSISNLGSSSSSLSSSPPVQSYAAMAASSANPGNAPANANISASAAAAASNVTVIRYFINDEIAKHRVRVIGEANVGSFSQLLKTQHKLSHDFAIFMFDQAENRLRVLKDSTPIYGTPVYYVLENSRIDDLYRKVEKRVKKDLAALSAVSGKTATWNSENNPLRVDFIPDNELYLSEAGRIGLCMCPGRKKKKTAHEWDRDLDKDLLRIRDHYKCDVVVSLVRRSELVDLKIPTLLEEVEKLGMESIHFPIKDKWIPESMAGVINLVDTLINRLKIGKTIVIHCNGGKGRSGTVAVACMVAMGKRVVQSIDVVRKARSGTIRNPAQIFYVKRFKTAFKNYQKKKQALIEARGTALAPKDQEALAEQVASDPLLEAESDSDSEMSEAMSSRKEEKAAEKARKEAEKAQEKARKEEEKAAEKARKEEEKAEKAQEKAQEKAEKAQEKARKEEEKKKKTGTPARGSAEIDPAALLSAPSPIPFDVQNLTQSEEAAEAKPGSGVAKRAKADKTPAGSASSSPNISHVEKADKGAVPLVSTASVAKAEENGSVQPPEISSPKRAASRRKSVKDGPKAQKTNVINTDDAMAGSD